MTTTVNGTPQFVIISIELNQKQIQISWGLNQKMQYNEPKDINNFLGDAKINYNYIEFNEPKFDGTQYTNTGLGIHLDQLCAAAIQLGQMEQSTQLFNSVGEKLAKQKMSGV